MAGLSDTAKLKSVGPGTCMRADGAWLWSCFEGCCGAPHLLTSVCVFSLAHLFVNTLGQPQLHWQSSRNWGLFACWRCWEKV